MCKKKDLYDYTLKYSDFIYNRIGYSGYLNKSYYTSKIIKKEGSLNFVNGKKDLGKMYVHLLSSHFYL